MLDNIELIARAYHQPVRKMIIINKCIYDNEEEDVYGNLDAEQFNIAIYQLEDVKKATKHVYKIVQAVGTVHTDRPYCAKNTACYFAKNHEYNIECHLRLIPFIIEN